MRNVHGKTSGGTWRFQTASNASGEAFRRCDANNDRETNISDASSILNFLFLGLGQRPTCLDALDCDDTGEVELTDGVFLLNFLFNAGGRPPAPLDSCSKDPTADGLGCLSSGCGV